MPPAKQIIAVLPTLFGPWAHLALENLARVSRSKC